MVFIVKDIKGSLLTHEEREICEGFAKKVDNSHYIEKRGANPLHTGNQHFYGKVAEFIARDVLEKHYGFPVGFKIDVKIYDREGKNWNPDLVHIDSKIPKVAVKCCYHTMRNCKTGK